MAGFLVSWRRTSGLVWILKFTPSRFEEFVKLVCFFTGNCKPLREVSPEVKGGAHGWAPICFWCCVLFGMSCFAFTRITSTVSSGLYFMFLRITSSFPHGTHRTTCSHPSKFPSSSSHCWCRRQLGVRGKKVYRISLSLIFFSLHPFFPISLPSLHCRGFCSSGRNCSLSQIWLARFVRFFPFAPIFFLLFPLSMALSANREVIAGIASISPTATNLKKDSCLESSSQCAECGVDWNDWDVMEKARKSLQECSNRIFVTHSAKS